ncbi:HAD family hydrolase [Candidatus Kaiserbacteria bacterium]|nr:HAD family hydrolase [Candidatus Kaiserbacteria bacterium]
MMTALAEYRLLPGTRTAVDYLRDAGYELALITGAFDILAARVAADLSITHAAGCATVVFDEHGVLQTIETSGDEPAAKAAKLRDLCARLGISPGQCACIGDGINDLDLFRETGHGIALRGTPVEHDAWQVIDSLHDIPRIFSTQKAAPEVR